MGAPEVRWLTLVLDGRAAELWREVDGASLDVGHLRTGSRPGPEGAHLDLHVVDLEEAMACATEAGAELVSHEGPVALRSPGGFGFGLVADDRERATTPPTTWPDGHRSRLDQIAVDVRHEAWERELAFWSDLTGWEVTVAARPEFARLATPARLPVRVLLHRRRAGATAAHVDVATDDREAEVRRLEGLGLRRLAHGPTWTVLQAPRGPALCVTDRDPVTGLLR